MASKKESVGKRKAQPIFTHNLKLVLLLVFTLILSLEFLVIQRTFSDFYRQSDLEIQALINDGKEQLNLAKKDALQPLGLSAALAAGSKNINFFWTPNNDSTQFYRLYHGIESHKYNESYDSQLKANSIEFDYSQMSLKTHYFALTAIGSNGVESATSTEIAIDLGNLNKCGNGLIEPGNGEICDNNFKDCIFGSGRYRGKKMCISSGTDACKAWDSTCQAAEFCGDGITNGDEACDGQGTFTCNLGLYTGQASCDSTCSLNGCNIGTQSCGNGISEGREQCEMDTAGNWPPAQNCTWNGFAGKKNCSACLWSDCLVTPACGPNNGKDLTSLTYYDSGNCSPGVVGSFAFNSSAGTWSWNCGGSSGATPASCSATKRTNGVCGLANDVPSSVTPTTDLCSGGTATQAIASGVKYIWTCNGSGAGSTSASCSAPICGNGTVTSPEQCDFGSANNSATSGCNLNCKFDNNLYSCPPLPSVGQNIFNTVSAYNIKCTGANGTNDACGAWEPLPIRDLDTEYNITPSNTACRFKCAPNYGKCLVDTSCQTPLTTPNNCVSCGKICDSTINKHCVTTASGPACVCADPFKDCDANEINGCETNVNSSNNNCGDCANICPTSRPRCVSGACGCALGLTECSGSLDVCVDLNTNDQNCGECGKSCGSDATCFSGTCVCKQVGFVWNGSQCVQSCGNGVKDPGEQCDFGTNELRQIGPMGWFKCNSFTAPKSCKLYRVASCDQPGSFNNPYTIQHLNWWCTNPPSSAPFLYNAVRQYCLDEGVINYQGDPNKPYCANKWDVKYEPRFVEQVFGACNAYTNLCSYNCANGWGNCDGSDSNTCETSVTNNSNFCGSSCAKCSNGQFCQGSVCESCPIPQLDCDRIGGPNTNTGCEVNSNIDINNCGACGVKCEGEHKQCAGGQCKCDDNWGDCDEDPENGCEYEGLLSDELNCGSCGNVCLSKSVCNNGTCQYCKGSICTNDQ